MPKMIEYNEWECKYCHSIFPTEIKALGCEKAHEIILVPLYREDIQRLIQFLYTKDEALLTERLTKTLLKYNTAMKGSQG